MGDEDEAEWVQMRTWCKGVVVKGKFRTYF